MLVFLFFRVTFAVMAGIYIHIPFCKSRCSYCDFYSSTFLGNREEIISNICQEIKEQKNFFIHNENIKTIYFGGGTPSLLSLEELKTIFDTIEKNFVLDLHEVTLEANPDDLNKEKIAEITQLPINRLSIGVQSFNNNDLRVFNRRHSAQQAIDAVKLCQDKGLNNISIDLIYGIPSQTMEEWSRNLDIAISLKCPHISAYHLTFEEGAKITKQRDKGEINELNEEESIGLYKLLVQKLTNANILQYEISNFAIPGMESKHNSSYWNETPYLGVGPSAHSFNGKFRKWNISNSRLYLQNRKEKKAYFELESIDNNTKYNDFVITSLRTIRGMNLNLLKENYSLKIVEHCLREAKRFISTGDMIINGEFLALSNNGIFKSDFIMENLLWVEE